MTETITLTVKQEIAYNEEFLKLKRERRISKITNDLWKSHLNIKTNTVPTEKANIEDELRELSARKAVLMNKKQEMDKLEEQEKSRYLIIE